MRWYVRILNDLTGRRIVQIRLNSLIIYYRPHGKGFTGPKTGFVYHYPPLLQYVWC